MKTRTRGSPSFKVDTFTRRELSAFELVESTQDRYSPVAIVATLVNSGTSLKKSKAEIVDKLRVIRTRTRSLKASIYIDAFPSALQPFITHVNDSAADNNCGFRAIAGLIGFGEDS